MTGSGSTGPTNERGRIAVVGTVSSSMVRFRGPLLASMADAGQQVYAFAIDYDEERADQIRQLGAHPVSYSMDRTGTNPLQDLRTVRELRRAFTDLRIDTVLTYFLKPVVLGSMAAVLARVPRRFAKLPGLGALFTESGSGSTGVHSFTRWAGYAGLKIALGSNQGLFLYNEEDEAELVEKRLVKPSKIHRINGTGVDLSAYRVAPPVTSPVTFLMIARLLVDKGVREFAEAARIVRRHSPESRFVLLGRTDTNPSAIDEEEVREWVHEGLLEWPGHVSDVRPWLRRASVFVLPSYYREGVPRSTQEAMALGRPVITTDAIGCRKTVEPGTNGFLVSVGDADALAARMMDFVRSPDLIPRMGAASRRLAEDRFDVHAINAEILKVMFPTDRRTDEVGLIGKGQA